MNKIICNTEKANIMVLMLKKILERNLKVSETSKKISGLNYTFFLKAGEMKCVLKINFGEIILATPENENYTTKVEGSLKDFLGIAMGKYPVGSFLQRKFKIKGDPLALLPLLSLFKVKDKITDF